MASIIAEKAKAGDVSSSAVLRERSLAARDLLTLASMVARLIKPKSNSAPIVPVDLTRLALDLAAATVKKTEGYSKTEYADRVADAAYNGPVFSPSSGDVSTEAAAFRTSNPGENDPAREAALKYSKENKSEEAIDSYDAVRIVAEKYSTTTSTEAEATYNSAYAVNESTQAPVEPLPQAVLPPAESSTSPEPSPPPSSMPTSEISPP